MIIYTLAPVTFVCLFSKSFQSTALSVNIVQCRVSKFTFELYLRGKKKRIRRKKKMHDYTVTNRKLVSVQGLKLAGTVYNYLC